MPDGHEQVVTPDGTQTEDRATETAPDSRGPAGLRGTGYTEGAAMLAPGAAVATNEGLGFNPTSVGLLRQAVGLSRRGSLDAGFATALAAFQTTAGLAGNGLLSADTVRRLPVLRRPAGAVAWYRRNPAPWSAIPEAERSSAAAEIGRSIGAGVGDVTWNDSGRRTRLDVSENFVQRAAAWQLWQRCGLTVDGKLGASAFVRMGRAVGGSAGDRVRFNAGLRTGGGRHGATDEIRGERNPRVGVPALAGDLTARELIEAMLAAHPDVVRRHLGDSVSPDDFGSMSDMAGQMDGFLALLATPEALAVQRQRFVDTEVADLELRASQIDGGGTYGMMALLSVVDRPAPAAEPGRATELALIRAHVEAAMTGQPPRVTAVVHHYAEALYAHFVESTGARPDFGAMARAIEEQEQANIGFELDDQGNYVVPGDVRALEGVLARFGRVWSSP